MSKKPKRHISQIVIDRKVEYGDLAEKLGRDHWLVFNVSRQPGFVIGLQPSEGVPVRSWIQALCNSLAGRAKLVSSATNMAKMMEWTAASLNPPGRTGPFQFPDFALLLEVAQNSNWTLWGGKEDYNRTLIHTLQALAYHCP